MPSYHESKSAPFCEIRFNGQLIDEAALRSLQSMTITESMERADTLNLAFGGWNRISVDFGADVEVKLGYHGSDERLVFNGFVKQMEPRYSSGGDGVTVSAFDYMMKLDAMERQKTILNQSYEAIVRQTCSQYGGIEAYDFGKGTAHKATPRKQISIDKITDYEFLQTLANMIGYRLWLAHVTGEGGKRRMTVHFKQPEMGGLPIMVYRPTLDELRGGAIEIESFGPNADIADQLSGIDVVSEKTEEAEAISVSSGPLLADGDRAVTEIVYQVYGDRRQAVIHNFPDDPAEARALAQAILEERARRFVTGQVTLTAGNPGVRPGQVRQIIVRGNGKSLDSRFSGYYRIEQVTSTYSGSGYETRFEIGRNSLNASPTQ